MVNKSNIKDVSFVNPKKRINKKALSNLVAYVLLITITISLSIMVYGWLKFYVEGEGVEDCPEGVNLVIESYSCSGNNLYVNLRNKGLFTVDGFILRTNNRDGAEFGVNILANVTIGLSPGANYSNTYVFPGAPNSIKLVDVQPFLDDGKRISCKSYASQRVSCI